MNKRNVLGALLGCFTATAVHAQNLPNVKPEQSAQLDKEIGAALTAKPAKARRVLVFWKCEGFVHGEAIAVGNEALRLATEKTKAFQADFSNDYEALRLANLEKYDALVLNNATGLKENEHRFLMPDLTAFVKSGKGLTVIHAGADSFYDAAEVAEMIGGQFWGHPWGGGGTWAFHLDEPSNALNAAFGGKDFKQGEEVYMQKPPFFCRAKCRVLVSLDLKDEATGKVNGKKRADNDYAVSWIKPYGQGRVFYTSFGHDARAWLAPATLRHILDGLQYTLGDLNADDSPAGLSAADLKRIAASIEQTEVYSELIDLFAHTDSQNVDKANRDKIAALLAARETAPEARKGILRALVTTSSLSDLSGVAASLAVPEARGAALTLLAQTATPQAADCLNAAWGKADAELRCGILNAFALRGDSAAVAAHLDDADDSVDSAALLALGRIGDEKALQELSKTAKAPALEPVRCTALAACIGRFVERKETAKVAAAARALFGQAQTPVLLRTAAARALVLDDAAFFKTAVKDSDRFVRQAAIRAAGKAPAADLIAALKAASDPAEKVMLISRLAANQAKEAVPALVECLAAQDEGVVCEALGALTSLGGLNELAAIEALASREGPVGNAAQTALQDMPGREIGQALFQAAKKNHALLPVLGERMEIALLAEWKPFLTDTDDQVRKDAWKALGKNATEKTFATFAGWLGDVKQPETYAAESTVAAAAKQVDGQTREDALANAWNNDKAIAPRQVLAGLMGSFPSARFLPLLAEGLKDPAESLRETSAEALGKWPDFSPSDTLLKAYAAQTDKGTRRAILQSYMKLANAFAGADYPAKVLALFSQASESERSRLADILFTNRALDAFPILQRFFTDGACGAAAKKCYAALYDKNIKNLTSISIKEVPSNLWKAKASHNERNAKKAFDNNPKTRWETGTPSEPGMWFSVDLGENLFLTKLVMDTEDSPHDTPNGCEVYTSLNGKDWTGPVATADGKTTKSTSLAFTASARQLKIVTTGSRKGLYWSIHELHVFSGVDKNALDAIAKTANSIR